MLRRIREHPRFDRIDTAIADWMERWGHLFDRVAIGALFIWFGALKLFGYKSATSIIGETIYFGSPEVTVPLLGVWEIMIGVCLIHRPFARVAVALLVIRLPGTALALLLRRDVCWTEHAFVPTVQGAYLIKDLILFSAAMIIGGTVREEKRRAGAAARAPHALNQ